MYKFSSFREPISKLSEEYPLTTLGVEINQKASILITQKKVLAIFNICIFEERVHFDTSEKTFWLILLPKQVLFLQKLSSCCRKKIIWTEISLSVDLYLAVIF